MNFAIAKKRLDDFRSRSSKPHQRTRRKRKDIPSLNKKKEIEILRKAISKALSKSSKQKKIVNRVHSGCACCCRILPTLGRKKPFDYIQKLMKLVPASVLLEEYVKDQDQDNDQETKQALLEAKLNSRKLPLNIKIKHISSH